MVIFHFVGNEYTTLKQPDLERVKI